MPSSSRPHVLPPGGGYRRLLTYQKAEVIYDGTVHFAARYLDFRDRTVDQMVQAARSGKQNIAEASLASRVSKESEIKLTNVARASLEELLIDYADYLRLRKLPLWAPGGEDARRFRQLNMLVPICYETFRGDLEESPPVHAANTLSALIRVTCYLLDRQIARLEADFLSQGGVRERMSQARRNFRESR